MAQHVPKPFTGSSDRPRLVPPLPDPAPSTVDLLHQAIASTHWSGSSLSGLAGRVGGIEQLSVLTTDPLPPTTVDPAQYVDAVRTVVRSVIDVVDTRMPKWLHGEERTIVHRLVLRLADQPDLLGQGDPDRTAAALVWLVLRSRETGRRSQAGWVWSALGVRPSAPRAHALHRALGFPAGALAELPPCSLPDPELLTSADRKQIIAQRDSMLEYYADHLRQVEEARPLRRTATGQLEARSRVVRPVFSAQGSVEGGRRMVMIAVDHVAALDQAPRDPSRPDDDVDEVIILTVPDAWLLLQQLQHALTGATTPVCHKAPIQRM